MANTTGPKPKKKTKGGPKGNPHLKKGVQPPWLKGHDFKAHPEHIVGGYKPTKFHELAKMAQDMGNETIELEIGPSSKRQKIKVTKFQAILLDWLQSQSFEKQKAVIEHAFGKIPDKLVLTDETESKPFVFPADVIAGSFVEAFRVMKARKFIEYIFHGGRGSTKSSFVSLVIIYLLITNPEVHALVTRQVANTLRDSVYAQLCWAIDILGLTDQFKCTTSPLEIEYKPTGQKIFFRGADDPNKIKSIKAPFGYIAILWFEELDQFHGEEAVRKIEQSAIRGGEKAWIIKSFNPPRTSANWANKYVQIPKASQYQHSSNYKDVPLEWLGPVFIDEAEHLQQVNPDAYEHEYLGVVNGTGGQVFDNVKIRAITDEEIKQFDRLYEGIDWGFYPDPFAWVRCYYDAARMTLYIFDEHRAQKKGNKPVYEELVKKKNLNKNPNTVIIADSAEPKSVADFRTYGANIRGAEKGPESVTYSMKWLQSLAAIVIDPVRCPYSKQEFIDYELEEDKDGNYISEYPDKNNHFIDATRYAMNIKWRRRGE
jgi:phage terminase large subunit